MGQGAIISAIAISFIIIIFITNSQEISRDTELTQANHQYNQMARDLAMKGHKLVLANWIALGGRNATLPFSGPVAEEGGTYELPAGTYSLSNDILEFTVRGTYNGAVHEVHSRYRWNGFGLNPFQLKTVGINFTISPAANLENIDQLIVDDQAIAELENILINELNYGSSLAELGLGITDLVNEINTAFSTSGHPIDIQVVDQDYRDAYQSVNGMYYPDQVLQAVDTYVANHPGSETTVYGSSGIPTSFGGSGSMVLRVEADMILQYGESLTGSGVLIVEGDMIIQDGANLDWDGLVIVQPPDGTLNPQIDFSGSVEIDGGLVALHESIPNSGHMDVSTWRDYSGAWSSPHGVDHKLWYWPWCMYHRHDYTSLYGNHVAFHSDNYLEREHESEIHFYETLNALNGTDQVFLEINNAGAGGLGIITIELTGENRVSYPVAAGFDPSIASGATPYRTRTFTVNELDYFHIGIRQLSLLRKMWDTGELYDNCTSESGPICVGNAYNRMGALTLRLYKIQYGAEKRIYEASLYWHRQEEEQEDFESEMENLLNTLTSSDYGLDINLGDNTHITINNASIQFLLNEISGGNITIQNLGTSHRHWNAGDQDNPLHKSSY